MEEYKLDLLDFLPAYEELDPLYNYYEDKDPRDINKSIFLKKEFNELQTDNTVQQIEKGKFRPLNHQSFVARFLSQYTPYNKLLAVHEVGTGKTCLSSLTAEIAKTENPFLKETLFIVKNDTLKRNVVREISEVCTSGKYLPSSDIKDPRQYTMALNRMIGRNYMMYTYYEVKKEIENMTDSEIDIFFSNRVIIIDEAHNLCIKSEDSEVYNYIYRMLHNIHNYKILLLTATPMRDTPKDIALILNLLLPEEDKFDDKKFMSEYFDSDKNFLPSKREKFFNKTRGLISYLRASSSSVTRIYEGEQVQGVSSRIKTVEMKDGIQAQSYGKAYELDNNSSSSGGISDTCKKPNPGEVDEDAPDDDDISCFYSNSRQASVFVAPDGTYGSSIVEAGWYNQSSAESAQQISKIDAAIKLINKTLDDYESYLRGDYEISEETRNKIIEDKPRVQKELEKKLKEKNENVSYKSSKKTTGEISRKLADYLKSDGDNTESMLNKLENLSIKYASIIRVLLSEESRNDKAFIYSNMVSFTGANLLAALFKFFGFEHVRMPTDSDRMQRNEKLLLDSFRSKSGKPQFLLITGSSIDSRASDFLINKIYNNPLNQNGEIIKIVIASRIIGEGSSFKHTRQLHIVSPGWNETELVQAQGRAIRAFSHDIFPPDQRYVKIYRWCAVAGELDTVPPSGGLNVSIDYILYKICSEKDRPIKQIERLLKMSAVDCAMNYKRNMNLNQDTNRSYDTDKTRECDYDDCVYQCVGVPSEWYLGGNPPELIYDSYNLYYAEEKLEEIRIKIEELFRKRFMFDFFSLVNELRDVATDIIIVRSLKKIIDESIPIMNKYNIKSYLREDNNFYFLTDTLVFSPHYKFLQAYYNSNPIIKEQDTYDQILLKFECRYFDEKLKLLGDENLTNSQFDRIVNSIGHNITDIMIEKFILAKYSGKTENEKLRERFLKFYENIKTIVIKDDKGGRNTKVYFKPKNKMVRVFPISSLEWRDGTETEASEYSELVKQKQETLKRDNPFGFYGIYMVKDKETKFGFVTFFDNNIALAKSTGKVNKAKLNKGTSCAQPGGNYPAVYNQILLMSVVIISTVLGMNLKFVDKGVPISANNKKLQQTIRDVGKSDNENIGFVVKNILKYLKISNWEQILPTVEKEYPYILNILNGVASMNRSDICGVLEKICVELDFITSMKK